MEHFLDIDMDLNDKETSGIQKKKPHQFVYTFKRVLDTTEFYDTGLLEPQMRLFARKQSGRQNIGGPRTAPVELDFL